MTSVRECSIPIIVVRETSHIESRLGVCLVIGQESDAAVPNMSKVVSNLPYKPLLSHGMEEKLVTDLKSIQIVVDYFCLLQSYN